VANAQPQSYGYNYAYFSSNPNITSAAKHQKNPKQQVVLAADSANVVSFSAPNYGYCVWPSSTTFPLGDRHSQGANALFIDGHVEYFKTAFLIGPDQYAKYWWPD
jgi:prepilin-type processing-associated H-X9-DG protein